MSQRDQIAAFLGELTLHDGFAPFSDAKLPVDPASGRAVLVAEDGAILAMGAVASHTQSDGSEHWALETAVQPRMRFPAFEEAVLDASLALVARDQSFSVWSRRSSLDRILTARDFVTNRTLEFLVVELPLDVTLPPADAFRIRTFNNDDIAGMIAVNRAAFENHREAGTMDTEEMGRYQSESWFDAGGIFIADSRLGRTLGFCWTKVHPNGDGEIFRIAVDPQAQGSGLGVALLAEGFDYLSRRPDTRRGVLWVDAANTRATAMYRSIGMTQDASNREFSPG